MSKRLSEEADLALRRGEELLEKSAHVVMCDVAERHRKTLVEAFRELLLREIPLDEFDELAGELGLLLGSLPLSGRELVGREVGDVGEIAHALLGTIKE